MIKQILQPYRKMEAMQVQMLAQSGYIYWVSQSYDRAGHEFDHTKTALLFSAYKELKDASKHYNAKKEDKLAAILDVRKKAHAGKLINLCNGTTDIAPFISLIGNTQVLDNFLRRHYYDSYRAWVRDHRPQWDIRQHNAVEPHFTSIFGEPAVKITYGSQHVVVLLEELEKL